MSCSEPHLKLLLVLVQLQKHLQLSRVCGGVEVHMGLATPLSENPKGASCCSTPSYSDVPLE